MWHGGCTLSPAMDLVDCVAATMFQPPGDTLPARLFKEVLDLEEVAARLGYNDAARSAAVSDARRRAEAALTAGASKGLTAIGLNDERYSPWLREIVDPPSVLWVRGRTPPFDRPTVAVVGSRQATPAGLQMGRHLGEGLAAAGLIVISGLARGVDGASHQGALAAGGLTIGVLGCGADVVYPSEHRELASQVAASGGVISEFPPGTSPLSHHFPLRNRIISGLARAVVVIEAGEKSGSLITAKMAMEQGREVMVVPGNVLSGRNRGGHSLIKDGARLVESVSDVLADLGMNRGIDKCGIDKCGIDDFGSDNLVIENELSRQMAIGETYDADTLAGLTGWDVSRLLSELAALELRGQVSRSAGGWTRLAGRAC
ncbi:MAG: DNA-protecting protein DprA [Acidobacteria bacterium]|nr:MAG: DNA-protecting protein DprA [Acidobacteriota bacterium]